MKDGPPLLGFLSLTSHQLKASADRENWCFRRVEPFFESLGCCIYVDGGQKSGKKHQLHMVIISSMVFCISSITLVSKMCL